MITNDLLQFIREQRHKGISDDVIKNVLVGNTWSPADVDEAYRVLAGLAPMPVQKENTPRPAFSTESIITGSYVVIVGIAFMNSNEAAAQILFYATIIVGIVAGVACLGSIVKLSKGKSGPVRVLSALAGAGAGFVIFIVALVGGFTGLLKNIHGD